MEMEGREMMMVDDNEDGKERKIVSVHRTQRQAAFAAVVWIMLTRMIIIIIWWCG